MDVEGTIPGGVSLEGRIHFDNRSKKNRGEWFRLTSEEVKRIILKYTPRRTPEVLSSNLARDGFVSELKRINSLPSDGFLSATEIVRVGNAWRTSNGDPSFNLSAWLKTKQTQEFLEELEGRFGQVLIKGRGKGNQTWVHPLLFIDLALAISPKLKIEVYEWLFDHLLKHRNDSGDSYKLMCGVLYVRHRNSRTFSGIISDLALRIQGACGVSDWQKATEEQLAQRNKIHEEIALLADVMNNNEVAIEIVFNRLSKSLG